MISQVVFIAALASLAAAHVIPVHAPQPYKFGYDIKDKHGNQYREETGNGAGGVKGSYGFTDDRGVRRQVEYVADHAGFRAQVKTNEPGTANQNPAAVQMISDAPYAGGVALGGVGYGMGGLSLGGLGGVGLGYGGLGVGGFGYGMDASAVGALGYGAGVPAVGGYGIGVPAVGGYEMGVPAVGGYGIGIPAVGGYGIGVPAVGGYEMGVPAVGGYGLGYGELGLDLP